VFATESAQTKFAITELLEKNMKKIAVVVLPIFLYAAVTASVAEDLHADKEVLAQVISKEPYSPYAGRTFPGRPLWGDTHLHTSLSFDAGAFGNRLDPSTAYRFARGEEIIATTGQPVRLGRPLDWLAITDHSDGMGFTNDALTSSPFVTKYEQGAR
jgi:hypothetical protein